MTRFEISYLICAPFSLFLLLQFIGLAWLDRRLPRWAFSPLILIFAIEDVIYNCTCAWLIFEERPREWLLTTRLKKLGDDKRAERFRIALNDIDPGHV